MEKHAILRDLTFGRRVAEEETEILSTYFVETDQWRRLLRGDIDIVYGPKGAGKSALYSLLLSKDTELFDRNILLVPAENPRGATAFTHVATEPPTSEPEFVGLWKLYLASLLHGAASDLGIRNAAFSELEAALARDGLVKGTLTLGGILRAALDYVRRLARPQGVEGGLKFDPLTGLPSGFTGKILFSDPRPEDAEAGFRSVDQLLRLANTALETAGYQAWLLLDRLDVAFSDDSRLEGNALRALFRVYLDLAALGNIRIKVFLRTDIWARITEEGFREASHITRTVTITWNRNSLLNLVVRRALQNDSLRRGYGVSPALAADEVQRQEQFFYRMCPGQVDAGPNKPNTFDWLLSRTRDGLKSNAPRELIHILNSLRDVQIRRFEIGETPPEGEQLFARPAFKEALPEVSVTRLQQTLYAEYPAQKEWLERLRGARTSQTDETLSSIWSVSTEEARARAGQLVAIGFFENRGTRESAEYWVPFLYRDGLDMVQGSAE